VYILCVCRRVDKDITMEEYLKFAQVHPVLVFGFLGMLGMIIWLEYSRINRKYAQVNVNDAVRLLNNDEALVLDVREDKEILTGKIKGAHHIPVGNLASRLNEFSQYKQKDVLIYCRSGSRSAHACNILTKDGFEKVSNLAGGIMAWESANLPISKT